jgi:hypothetical protein
VSAPRAALPRWPAWPLLPIAAALAWLAGGLLATGGPWQAAIFGVSVVLLAALLARAALPRLGSGWLTVELPVLLLLISGLVWRGRSTDSLAANPLDSAGILRVACVGLAGLLGTIACLIPARASGRMTSAPFRLYGAYVLVVFIGAPLSVNPPLTAYRGVELAAGLIVLLGARRSLGEAAVGRIEATLYWFVVALIASVWIGVVVFPDRAIEHFTRSAPVPWDITGVYPSISANGVGTLGVLLTVWSLARSRPRPAFRYVLAAIGTISLLAAQYRTGYAALALALGVLLLLRRRWGLAALSLVLAIGILIWEPGIVGEATPFVLRGASVEEAKQLDSRLTWWEAALPVWQESPLIGRGLLTGTRFEVLARMGLGETSSIHGTWIEALVGTGLLGLALLISSYLTALRAALAIALRGGWCIPLVLLVVLGVRSLTGPTFESFSQHSLILLWVALAVADPRPHPEEEATRPATSLSDR